MPPCRRGRLHHFPEQACRKSLLHIMSVQSTFSNKKSGANLRRRACRKTTKSPTHRSQVPAQIALTVMSKQAVLLAQIHRPIMPSQRFLQWPFMKDSSYSGGTAPTSIGFPIKSCDTCLQQYVVFIFILTLFIWDCQYSRILLQ